MKEMDDPEVLEALVKQLYENCRELRIGNQRLGWTFLDKDHDLLERSYERVTDNE